MHGSISISGNQILIFKITSCILTGASMWIICVGAFLYSMHAFSDESGVSRSIANGSVRMGILALAVVIGLAIMFPALLLLQPFRLWRVLRAEHEALTPRQRFRGGLFVSYARHCLTPNSCSCISTDL